MSEPAAAGDDPERTAERLLMLLKTRGEMTTRQLAAALEVTVPAVRQHLQSQQALVAVREQRGGRGRPAQLWRLSAAGQRRFPDTHAELTVRLIGNIRETLGESALERILAARHDETLEHYRAALVGVSTLAGRLKRLARLRSEEGYMAEVRRDDAGAWLLIEHHCPICAAAQACQQFCRNELALFRDVLGDGVEVTRTEYLLEAPSEAGARCAYRVSPR